LEEVTNVLKKQDFLGKSLNKNSCQAPGQWVLFLPNATLPIGHWTLLSKIGDQLEYFDSYGRPPPNEVLDQIPRTTAVTYNAIPYQKRGGKINTCGFHTLFRAFTQKHMGMDLKQYKDFMKSPKDHDRAVVYYVTNYLDKIPT